MLQRLIRTKNDFTLTIARVILAAIFLGHGSQKVLGWFGGRGPAGTIELFEKTMGIPAFLTVLVMFTEMSGGLGLAVGLLGRVAAGGLLCVMVVAPFANHLYPRFFMNWTGNRGGEGYEYHLLAIALLLVVAYRGCGALSLDRFLSKSKD